MKKLLAVLLTFGAVSVFAQLPHMALKYACEKEGGTWDKATRTCYPAGGTPTHPQKAGSSYGGVGDPIPQEPEKEEPKDSVDGRAAQTPLVKQSVGTVTKYSIEVDASIAPYGYWPVPVPQKKCFYAEGYYDTENKLCWINIQ